MRVRTPLVLSFVAAAMVGGSALPAMAAAGDTATTFVLAGGSLAVTVAPTAILTAGVTGASSVSGSLGPVSVSDARGNKVGWTVSDVSTTFTGPQGSTSTAVSYNSGAVTKTGTITATSSGATTLTAATPAAVVTGTAASGNNTATWTPTLTVSLPTSALADTYSGTVTTSIA